MLDFKKYYTKFKYIGNSKNYIMSISKENNWDWRCTEFAYPLHSDEMIFVMQPVSDIGYGHKACIGMAAHIVTQSEIESEFEVVGEDNSLFE